MTHEKLNAWSHSIKDRATFFPTLLLRLTLPMELGYVFGIVRYDFFYYASITLIAELLFVVITILAIDAVLNGETIKFFSSIAVFIFIFAGGYQYQRKK